MSDGGAAPTRQAQGALRCLPAPELAEPPGPRNWQMASATTPENAPQDAGFAAGSEDKWAEQEGERRTYLRVHQGPGLDEVFHGVQVVVLCRLHQRGPLVLRAGVDIRSRLVRQGQAVCGQLPLQPQPGEDPATHMPQTRAVERPPELGEDRH